MTSNKEYTSKITLRVKVDAFEEDDAVDALSDLFSPGELCGVIIEKCEINSIEENERV